MNDNTLIKRCQNGDKAAFEALLNHHYDSIYRFAYRWCGDQHNAQDIAQLASMKLARSIGLFEFKSSFISWLYRLVINCAKDFYKSPNQYNQREQSNDEFNETLSVSVVDTNAQRLYAQQILEYINTLKDDLRDTLILVYGQGLSHNQAATHLSIKESTVSWRIHEARKQLKQTFSTPSLNDQAERGSL